MPAINLTPDRINKAEPGELRDAKVPGLICRVRSTGRVTFEAVLKARGVRKAQTLGVFPHMTVTMAREQARVWLNAEGAKLPARRGETALGSMTLREFAEAQYFQVANLSGESEARRVLGLDREKLNAKGRKDDALTWAELLEKPLREIRRRDIEDVIARWARSGAAPATINRKCTVLRAVLSKACDRHELTAHPMTGIKPLRVEDDARIETFTDAQRGAIYGVIDYCDREGAPYVKPDVGTAIYLLLNTGCRPGQEVARLRIDLRNRMVIVPTTTTSKAVKPRHIPINEVLAERLKTHKAWRMPSRKEWDTVMKRAGIESVVPYTARHDFLSRLANSGVPMHVVQKLAGHSSITITAKYYVHVESDALRAAVERV